MLNLSSIVIRADPKKLSSPKLQLNEVVTLIVVVVVVVAAAAVSSLPILKPHEHIMSDPYLLNN